MRGAAVDLPGRTAFPSGAGGRPPKGKLLATGVDGVWQDAWRRKRWPDSGAGKDRTP